MSGKGQYHRKRKRAFYIQAAKGKRGRKEYKLEPGMKGFLITCNKRERESVREAYNLLNEYADQLYGPEKLHKAEAAGSDDDEEEEDIEAAMEKEVASLKEAKHIERRFQNRDSGAMNCVFIKTTLDDPDKLMYEVISDIYQSQTSKSRYIMRMIPVVGSCRAEEDKIKQLAIDVLKNYFGSESKEMGNSYCVNFKVRNNTNSITRREILTMLWDEISDINPKVKVELVDPDYVINVDILKTVCCMSVMKDFFKFKKYNLQEVVNVKDTKADKEGTSEVVKETEGNEEVVALAKSEVSDTAEGSKEAQDVDLAGGDESVPQCEGGKAEEIEAVQIEQGVTDELEERAVTKEKDNTTNGEDKEIAEKDVDGKVEEAIATKEEAVDVEGETNVDPDVENKTKQ